MDLINDILLINKQTFKKTILSLRKNWIIIFTGIVYIILNIVLFNVIVRLFTGVLSIFAGIALAILSASLISNYLYLLFNIINYDKISLQDFKDGFTYFLRKIYTIFFFGWIGSFVLSSIGGMFGTSSLLLNTMITISIFVLLNPLPETLYLKSLEPLDSCVYSFDFMKENWLNWLLPNIVFYVLLYYLTGRLLTNLFATHLNFIFGLDGISIIMYLIGQLLFSFGMIYRGHLYKLLSTSTRRKRMYMNKF